MNTENNGVSIYNPKTRLIVISGCIALLLLLFGWPIADEYCTAQSEKQELATTITQAKQTIALLPTVEKRLTEKQAAFQETEKTIVSKDKLPDFQRELVRLAQQHNCRVTRLNIEHTTKRPWHQADLLNKTKQHKINLGQPTPFNLVTQPIKISIEGNIDQIKRLLQTMQKKKYAMSTQRFGLHPDTRQRKKIRLDLDLICVSLVRKNI